MDGMLGLAMVPEIELNPPGGKNKNFTSHIHPNVLDSYSVASLIIDYKFGIV